MMHTDTYRDSWYQFVLCCWFQLEQDPTTGNPCKMQLPAEAGKRKKVLRTEALLEV